MTVSASYQADEIAALRREVADLRADLGRIVRLSSVPLLKCDGAVVCALREVPIMAPPSHPAGTPSKGRAAPASDRRTSGIRFGHAGEWHDATSAEATLSYESSPVARRLAATDQPVSPDLIRFGCVS